MTNIKLKQLIDQMIKKSYKMLLKYVKKENKIKIHNKNENQLLMY